MINGGRLLSLSDRQLRLVTNAAKAVPQERRDSFLREVAAHLTSEPSDAAVLAALNVQLDRLSFCATANKELSR
jgi:hypothetical protein